MNESRHMYKLVKNAGRDMKLFGMLNISFLLKKLHSEETKYLFRQQRFEHLHRHLRQSRPLNSS